MGCPYNRKPGTAPNSFVHEGHPARVVFAPGARGGLVEELERLKSRRALVLTSPRWEREARDLLGAHAAATLAEARVHVPVEIATDAVGAAREAEADGLVAFGGGSAVGLAKIVARELGLPIVAVPTTYSGSEMTEIWGLTESGQKRTGRDPRVRPRTVLYDPELAARLPSHLAGLSALNALAHATEALYARRLDPVTRLFAEESARVIGRGLPALVAGSKEAVDDLLYGAWLAGVCLDRAAMGLHHKLCHVLGGSFDLGHAALHALLLPYGAAYNREAAPDAMDRLGRALGTGDAPAALQALARQAGAPRSLAELGMKETDLARALDLALAHPYENPRKVERGSLRVLLDDAFAGRSVATTAPG